MNSNENNSSVSAIKRLVGCMLFLLIASRLIIGTSYLLRNAEVSRFNIVGIKSDTPLDMVYVGGSAAYVYWQPLRAWDEYGFTSYSLATNFVQAECLKSYIQWSEEFQNPELYVIDARPFQYYADLENEPAIRNGADSMDIFMSERYDLLDEYFNNRDIEYDTDILSYYLDLSKYHSNVDNLGNRDAWLLIDNNRENLYRGYQWNIDYECVNMPEDFHTERRAMPKGHSMEILADLLDYCQELNDKEFLFIICPYEITKEHQMLYNTIQDAIEERGFVFLNANDYYEEIGLDFTSDFYNNWHVNTFGASKYTVFLGGYICDHYNLPDHRSDPEYSSWNDAATRFFEEDLIYQAQLIQFRRDYEAGILPEDDQE